jgi:hypothetical protein
MAVVANNAKSLKQVELSSYVVSAPAYTGAQMAPEPVQGVEPTIQDHLGQIAARLEKSNAVLNGLVNMLGEKLNVFVGPRLGDQASGDIAKQPSTLLYVIDSMQNHTAFLLDRLEKEVNRI